MIHITSLNGAEERRFESDGSSGEGERRLSGRELCSIHEVS
jgi:hypothetical protein